MVGIDQRAVRAKERAGDPAKCGPERVRVELVLEAERLCDRMAVIAEGRIVAMGAPRDLIAASGAATLEEMILKQTARA